MKKIIFLFCFLTVVCFAQDNKKDIEQIKIDGVNLGGKHIKPNKITCDDITGTWLRLNYVELTAASPIINITNLAGNIDKEMKIVYYINADVALGTQYGIQLNADTAGKYQYSHIQASTNSATAVASRVVNGNYILCADPASINDEIFGEFTFKISVGANTWRMFIGQYSVIDGNSETSRYLVNIGGCYTVKTGEITSVRIVNQSGLNLGIGSYMEVWVRK